MDKRFAHYNKSSFDCCGFEPEQTTTDPQTGVTYAWRIKQSSVSCVTSNGLRTGYAHADTLEKYNVANGVATGDVKANAPGDADYQPDYLDPVNCAVQHYEAHSTFIQDLGGLKAVVTVNNGMTYFFAPSTSLTLNLGFQPLPITIEGRNVSDGTPVNFYVKVDAQDPVFVNGTYTIPTQYPPFNIWIYGENTPPPNEV